jgi:hypothetical protein
MSLSLPFSRLTGLLWPGSLLILTEAKLGEQEATGNSGSERPKIEKSLVQPKDKEDFNADDEAASAVPTAASTAEAEYHQPKTESQFVETGSQFHVANGSNFKPSSKQSSNSEKHLKNLNHNVPVPPGAALLTSFIQRTLSDILLDSEKDPDNKLLQLLNDREVNERESNERGSNERPRDSGKVNQNWAEDKLKRLLAVENGNGALQNGSGGGKNDCIG